MVIIFKIFDLSTLENESGNYKVNFKLEGNSIAYLEGYVKMVNKVDNQNYLANKELNITIITSNLQCNESFTGTGKELAKSGSKGLVETNTGDLEYRYVGTQEEDEAGNINNYLCFGKDKCTDETDDNMYRIIGITEDGGLKIQKNKALTELVQWDSRYTEDIKWESSAIYTETLKNFYDDNQNVSQDMKDKIESHTWNTGDVTDFSSVINDSYGLKIYDQETKKASHIGYYGLAYLSDYYFAYDGVGNQVCNRDPYCKSWMIPDDYNIYWSGKNLEWTMSRFGSNGGSYYAWNITSTGGIGYPYLANLDAVRPVFYLKADSVIKSGSGTSDDPNILESAEEIGTRLATEKFGSVPSGFKTTPVADLYRFIGDNTAPINNYICFGTTTKNDCTNPDSNYLYRIIGLDKNNRLKLIKNASIGYNVWHLNGNGTKNAVWDSGDEKISAELYTNLNNSKFLTNTTYIPNGWSSKIADTNWYIRDSAGYGSGKTDTGDEVWSWEQKATATTPSKIGLMYLSDYYYSLDGTGNLDCYTQSKDQYQICKTSWLHISNNGDNNDESSYEWTMSRYGRNGSYYYAWRVNASGGAYYDALNYQYAVRPVFYLTSDVTLTTNSESSSPKGSLDNPWIIN